MGHTLRSRSQGNIYWYHRKRSFHKGYSSGIIIRCSKVMRNVKVFTKWVKLQGQGHRVKDNSNHGKVFSQEILMPNIRALTLSVQKLLARLKFSENGSNSKVNGTGLIIMVLTEGCLSRNTHA